MMKQKISGFIKKEPVLVIAALCALLSMLLVPPSAEYIDYIDFRVLALLFCLMSVVAGLQECGVFSVMSRKLLIHCGNIRLLRLVLVLLPFFSSMLITNDVALITFVPFAIAVLSRIHRQDQLLVVVILQTVAANLGSMATPVGNPQSLYLYTKYGIAAGDYFALMLPVAAVSLVILTAAALATRSAFVSVHFTQEERIREPKKLVLFIVLLVLSLLCVLRVLDYRISLAIVVISMLVFDRELFAKVDYMLLLTFVCFFVFSGNLGALESVNRLLSELLQKNTVLSSIAASQVISNVPAAVLLSAFTDNAKGLLLGTNIGGLGTLIASLASLISFKFYVKTKDAHAGKYILAFTVVNIICLAILYVSAAAMELL